MDKNGRIPDDTVRILREAIAEHQPVGSRMDDLVARTNLSEKQIRGWFTRETSKRKNQDVKEKREDLERQNTEYRAENQRLKDIYAENENKIQNIRQLLQQRQTCFLCAAKANSVNNSYIFTIPPGLEYEDLEIPISEYGPQVE